MTWEISLPLRFGATLSDNPSDGELADRCKRGDLRAFEHLYNQYSGRMKSLAFHLLGSRADAEDAVQEAFIKIHTALCGFERNSLLSTWIYRVLVNCCYDALRKRQRQAESSVAGEIPVQSKLPLKLALERAVARLNEKHRLVFLMFEVEGLKHSEIAGVLEVPEGTSRAWLFEAKRELKRLLMESGV